MFQENPNKKIQVKVGELKNNLSAYLRKVRRGARFVIADREHPTGRLIPYQKDDEEEPLEIIAPPKGYSGLGKLSFKEIAKLPDIVELLLEDRKRR